MPKTMATSQPASGETIEHLKHSLELTIPKVYGCLKTMIATKEVILAFSGTLHSRLHSLMMVVDFIWLDVCVSCKAIFQTDDAYEKRFHFKNLLASISEGYKILYGFCRKQQNHSVWMQVKLLFDALGNQEATNDVSYITEELIRFGKEDIDRKARDIAYHYNEDMMKVYDKTVSLSDEEKVMNTVNRLFGILEQISSLYERAYNTPKLTVANPNQYTIISTAVDLQYKVLQDNLDKDESLSLSIRTHLPAASHGIDTIASTILKAEHVRALFTGKSNATSNIRRITHFITLGKALMLLHYMLSDYGTVIDAYLHSTTGIECAMNMRRCVIIKTSVLEHLYGYSEDERGRSLWHKISRFIPADEPELKEMYDSVVVILKRLTDNSTDNELRVLLVHPYDNSRYVESVDATMQAIECLSPFLLLNDFKVMMNVYHACTQFIKELQNVITREASEESDQTRQQLFAKIADIEQVIDQSSMSCEQKAEFKESGEKLKNLLISLNSPTALK